MRISKVINRQHDLLVTIDGRNLSTNTKYTILELGYATYILEDIDDEAWILDNGEVVPSERKNGRNELRSSGSMLVTSDPILVALAYEGWWSRNGHPLPVNQLLPIPLLKEAIEIVRNRKILNDFNQKYAGNIPGLLK